MSRDAFERSKNAVKKYIYKGIWCYSKVACRRQEIKLKKNTAAAAVTQQELKEEKGVWEKKRAPHFTLFAVT